jgi:hypothetical protein
MRPLICTASAVAYSLLMSYSARRFAKLRGNQAFHVVRAPGSFIFLFQHMFRSDSSSSSSDSGSCLVTGRCVTLPSVFPFHGHLSLFTL